MTEIRILRGTSVQWATRNPILSAGEQGYETDTGIMKIGNGLTRYNDLQGFLPSGRIEDFIQGRVEEAFEDVIAEGGGVTQVEFVSHINDPTPHPAYDDGPSFFLLYQNAKV